MALALFLCLPATAGAVQLGEVVAQSAIGEPLRVEIRLAGGDPAQAADCLRVRAGAAAEGPWIPRARISTTGSGSNARVVLSDASRVNEPVVRIGVENRCGAQLRREYVLLLPFPGEVSLPATATAAPALAATPARAPSPAPAAQRRSAQSAGAPPIQTWYTVEGESLDSLASAMYPRDPAQQRRFIAAVAIANPALFPDAAARARPLPAGTELRVPEPSRIPASTPAPAPAARAAVPQPPPAPPRGDSPAAAPRSAAPTAAGAVRHDRLVVEMADEAPPQGTPESPLHARERELVASVDRSIQAQLELFERIRELERIQAALIERANQLGVGLPGQIAEAQATRAVAVPVAPPPPAVEQATEPVAAAAAAAAAERPNDWPLFLALFVAVVATLLGIQRFQRRAPAPRALPVAAALPPETAPGVWPEEARTTSGSEPLRGADITRPPKTLVEEEEPPQPNYDWAAPSLPPELPAPIVVHDEVVEEHESAVELADIMMSFGRMQGAAETLAEFIRSNPRQALQPWLKLLDVYRAAGMRPEFDGLSRQLNKTFNVRTVTWDSYDEARAAVERVEDMPHLVEQLCRDWGTVECQAYLEHLIRDNREGTRQGFPLSVIDELLTLATVLEAELGRYRPPVTTHSPTSTLH
ncbi:hypothetical protein E6C76_14145 [Pseudothauera nasutitermitis]|uniref:Type 4 pilus biogenesis n=1 Tax=Pseudothauera nasutitermitis TaxID=2565930 RepID=A0A4S4AUU6_9RHOO|nr:hypothetical protein E6C76_14145 [Pseudothauera nasutitermitis]